MSSSFAERLGVDGPCLNTSLRPDLYMFDEEYTCRQGVVTPTENWEKWTAIRDRVRAEFSETFLGITGGYETMYVIYTGLLGALFGAAAALVPALLLSVGVTLWHMYKPKPGLPETSGHVGGSPESVPLTSTCEAGKAVLPFVTRGTATIDSPV